MSRRRSATKREILPDPQHSSKLLAQFINHLMKSGKKSVAEKIVYDALNIASAQAKVPAKASDKEGDEGEGGKGGSQLKKISPLELFHQALDNIKPTVEVKSRRVGGATYQVPVEVRETRAVTLAMRWLIDSARQRSEKGMDKRLANEFLDAQQHKGNAVRKREESHRTAKANQAFAHFRW